MSDIYAKYKETLVEGLIEASGKNWEDGIWPPTGCRVIQILPLNGENNKSNRARAIRKYLNFDCRRCLPRDYTGLHQYSHHLNSSQLLCMMFSSPMIKDGKASEQMVKFIKDTIDVEISTAADCEFEYTEDFKNEYNFQLTNGKGKTIRKYEGTSFDFHIQDLNTQIFFEVKLTENGFGKADDNPRHREKATQYIELLPDELRDNVSTEDMLKHYQLFRNIIRTRNESSYVVFITDDKNPSTNKEIAEFSQKYPNLTRVKFLTWQEVRVISARNTKLTLPFQFKALM